MTPNVAVLAAIGNADYHPQARTYVTTSELVGASMAIATARGLVELLRTYQLLDAEQLDELSRLLPSRSADPLILARELLQRGWLTAYQINQLFQGNAKDLLLGHYLLLERLGEGGMGQVYKAREKRLGRIVALKVLRKERLTRPETVQRFYQEIQAAARLSHPNIVHAYDAEQIGTDHVFAMEFVDGIDLARLVKQAGPLPVTQACEYVRQAAIGLQHIHEHGMVHRDIKPANLMRTNQGEIIKLLDMGLARLLEDEAQAAAKRLTLMGVVMGTVDFIAPEQALNSRTADIRSDLYSLGCTFYFLLGGQVPFPVAEPMAKLLAHQCDAAAPLEKLRADVPPSVSAIVNRLMAKQPKERYQTPAELVLALAARSTVAVPSPSPVAAISSPRRSPRRPHFRFLWIAALVLVVPLLMGLLVYALRGDKQPPTSAAPDHGITPLQDREITNSLGMKLVHLDGGDFFMGSSLHEPHARPDEVPSHRVTITRPFYMGVHLVTVGNFRTFVTATGYWTQAEKAGRTRPGQVWLHPGWEQTDNHPVTCVSWNDAKAFCDWLGKKEGRTYRLPTEAEWEYACRAETTAAYSFGTDVKKLAEYAWYRDNAQGKAHPVGRLKPNAWGLFDMHGNLLEWCNDFYDARFYQKIVLTDPQGPPRGWQRVLRGGSWKSAAPECRSAQRNSGSPNASRNEWGFRVVMELRE